MNVSIRKGLLIGIGGVTKGGEPEPRGREGRRTGEASSGSSYASSSVGDPEAGGALQVDSRKDRSPSQYRQRHPGMSWRDYAFCDLDLSRMDDVGGMQKWRGTRGHAKCPPRPVGGGGIDGLRTAGAERRGGIGGWWWRKKDRRRIFLEN